MLRGTSVNTSYREWKNMLQRRGSEPVVVKSQIVLSRHMTSIAIGAEPGRGNSSNSRPGHSAESSRGNSFNSLPGHSAGQRSHSLTDADYLPTQAPFSYGRFNFKVYNCVL